MLYRWERERINLNNSFEGIEMYDPNLNFGNDIPSANNMNDFGPSYGNFNQNHGTFSSKRSKCKGPMVEIVKNQV